MPDSASYAQQGRELGESFVNLDEDSAAYTSQLGLMLEARRVRLYVTNGPVRIQFYSGQSHKRYEVIPRMEPAWGLLYFDGKSRPRRVELLGIMEERVDELLHD